MRPVNAALVLFAVLFGWLAWAFGDKDPFDLAFLIVTGAVLFEGVDRLADRRLERLRRR